MDAKSPANIPPPFLPASIATFLAKLCDLLDAAIKTMWDLFKSIVWSWKEKTIGEHYQFYGHNLGYRRSFNV
jgi:hypothetical protein